MKHMKKLAVLMAVLTSMSVLASCAKDADKEENSSSIESSVVEAPATIENIEEFLGNIYEGVPEDEMPMIMVTPITAENVEYMTGGLTMDDFKEAYVSEPGIGAIAHSVILFRANSPEDAENLAKKAEEAADPRKWICVEAEKVVVKYHGDMVLAVMSTEALTDAVVANFDKAFAE